VTDGIPSGLPALVRYVKLRRKATAIGIVEPTADELRARLRAATVRLEELDGPPADDAEGSAAGPAATMVAEALQVVAEVARRAGVDPEMALRLRADELREQIIAAETDSDVPD
jgi:hypothetical protein